MPIDIKNELERIMNEINKTSNISTVYLFGSYAYGNPNNNSDLDICVLTEDKSTRKIDIMKIIRKSIIKIQSMPIDLIVYYKDEFNERAAIECTMEHEILSKGVKLYG